MAGFIIGTIVILILAIRLIQVLRSCDEKDSTCIQVKLCAEGKMICSRKNTCTAYKRFSPSLSFPNARIGNPEKDKCSTNKSEV